MKEIEKMTEKEFLPIIGRDKGQVLVKIIHDSKPKRVLEIGTLIGYSAILMARELPAALVFRYWLCHVITSSLLQTTYNQWYDY